jgi:hypothetical protein
MFRTARTAASIARSLVLGSVSAATLTTLAATSVLVACASDSEPEYWIEKLQDPSWKARSIKRLGQFYEDALTKANKDENAPEVKGLLEKIVVPMTTIYVNDYESLDEETREDLIALVASFRDPRIEPALKKALEEFGKRGRGGKDVKWVSRAVRDMKLKSVAPDVLASFKKMKPSTKDGAYYRDFNEALVAVADPSWSPELIAILNEDNFPILDPNKKDPNAVNEYKDRLYQTVTAVQLLGDSKSAAAVEPLIKVVLDPARADAANEALLALTKIGKPSVDMAVQLLEGKLPALAEFQKKQTQKKNNLAAPPSGDLHLTPASIILGAIGRPEAIGPLTNAYKNAKEDADKVQFLSTLTMLPHTAEVKATFAEALTDLDADASAAAGNALQSLAEPAALFFDGSLVAPLLERADDLAREKDAGVVSASTLLLSAIKLMDDSQVRAVGAAVKKADAKANKDPSVAMYFRSVNEAFSAASDVVEKCKKDAECYLSAAKDPANQTQKTQMVAIKAVYSYAMLKGADSAKALAEAMPAFEEASVRYTASQAIDHFSPQGNVEIAKTLETIVDKRKDSPDKAKSAADKPLRDAVYRLRARAQ